MRAYNLLLLKSENVNSFKLYQYIGIYMYVFGNHNLWLNITVISWNLLHFDGSACGALKYMYISRR